MKKLKGSEYCLNALYVSYAVNQNAPCQFTPSHLMGHITVRQDSGIVSHFFLAVTAINYIYHHSQDAIVSFGVRFIPSVAQQFPSRTIIDLSINLSILYA